MAPLPVTFSDLEAVWNISNCRKIYSFRGPILHPAAMVVKLAWKQMVDSFMPNCYNVSSLLG